MNRILKVYETANDRRDPCIILSGKWVKALGFDIGAYINIHIKDEKIIIEKHAGVEPRK
jgi:hypothetical protein